VTRDTSSRGDPDTWARALDRHLADPETRGLMSARHRARHHFAWPVVARRHLDFFDALLEARAQP
jgi:glycosyltransferase involved in cell wall biosynthesis